MGEFGGRIGTILRWLRVANRRARKSLAFTGNNLNYVAVASLFLMDPAMAGMLLMLMAIIVVLPMSSDPLRAIPQSRLQLWPLEKRERIWLRLLSPWLNPVTWVVLGLVAWRKASGGIVALAAGVVATGFAAPGFLGGRGGAIWLPPPLSQMIRKNLRQMICTLDFCCGALIAIMALIWQALGTLPKEAHFPLTAVAMLSISTCALSLFGLEGAAGMTRYRLLPIRGWKILLAKDVAYLLLGLAIALPLSLSAAIAAALIALAIGHRTSVLMPRPQTRWRFQTGPSFGEAITQIVPMTGAAAAVVYTSEWFLPLCAIIWAASLWWYGRELDSQQM